MKSTQSSHVYKQRARTALTLILALAVLSPAAWPQTTASPSEFPAEAQAISPDALKARLAGNKFTSKYSNGTLATMSYEVDQSLQLDMSTGFSTQGTWRVDGSQICLQFGAGLPSGCGESKATEKHLYLRRFVNQEVIQLDLLTTPMAAPKGFTYINLDAGRTEGLFTKSPVYMRAIMLDKPSPQSDTALLFFRGWPGIWRFNEKTNASKTSPRGQITRDVYAKAGLTFVSMDCPTDQWGAEVVPGTVVSGPAPSCLDNYRSSKRHADDVRKVMQVLREQHGIRHFYLHGHSFGTISSRWLAKNLGSEIDGAIHSASINNPPNARAGYSVAGFDYASLPTPQLHIHHENDACVGTPYRAVKWYANNNLVTVRGGIAQGDPCGSGHLHSFEGRDEVVAQAIADWISTRKLSPMIGE